MSSKDDSGQVLEGGGIPRDHLSLGGTSGGGDDQVVGSSGSALLAHRDQELGMRSGDRRVVVDNGDDLFDLIDELPTAGPVNVVGQPDADQELSYGHGGDRHVVVIVDQFVEGRTRAVRVDKERRVEKDRGSGPDLGL